MLLIFLYFGMSLFSKSIFLGFIYCLHYKSNEEVEETLLRDFIENRIMQKLSYLFLVQVMRVRCASGKERSTTSEIKEDNN